MRKCIIVGGGDFSAALLPAREPGDLLIAADSGYAALTDAGILPDLCVGDFDSLGTVPAGDGVIRLPVVKDDTDTGYAVKLGLERGYRTFMLLGVLGGRRFSHSLAAVQMLAYLAARGARGEILDERCRIIVLGAGTLDFPAGYAGEISVLALSDEAVVTETGLFYTLDRAELTNTFPLGVSNHFTGAPARITVHAGTVAVILEQA